MWSILHTLYVVCTLHWYQSQLSLGLSFWLAKYHPVLRVAFIRPSHSHNEELVWSIPSLSRVCRCALWMIFILSALSNESFWHLTSCLLGVVHHFVAPSQSNTRITDGANSNKQTAEAEYSQQIQIATARLDCSFCQYDDITIPTVLNHTHLKPVKFTLFHPFEIRERALS